MKSRRFWAVALAVMITAGILSRVVETGFLVFDKYLGDALYASMVYAILRLLRPAAPVALQAMIVMAAIELFQLTGVAAHALLNEHWIIRMCARLLGTHFCWLDLLAYAFGIGCVSVTDRAPDRSYHSRRL